MAEDTDTRIPDNNRSGKASSSSAAADVVEAVLVGGPDSLSVELRRQRVAADEAKIKIMHLDGYEHFERDPDGDPRQPEVAFRWCQRTRIAE